MLIDCVDNAALLGTLSGSMGPADAGGVVASRNQHGPYCKARVTPTNTATIWRDAVRTMFTDLRTLYLRPDVDRVAWLASARRNGSANAWNEFVRVNGVRWRSNVAYRLEPPPPGPVPVIRSAEWFWPVPSMPLGRMSFSPVFTEPAEGVWISLRMRPVRTEGGPSFRSWFFQVRHTTTPSFNALGVELTPFFPDFLHRFEYNTLYQAIMRPWTFDGRIGPTYRTSSWSPPPP